MVSASCSGIILGFFWSFGFISSCFLLHNIVFKLVNCQQLFHGIFVDKLRFADTRKINHNCFKSASLISTSDNSGVFGSLLYFRTCDGTKVAKRVARCRCRVGNAKRCTKRSAASAHARTERNARARAKTSLLLGPSR